MTASTTLATRFLVTLVLCRRAYAALTVFEDTNNTLRYSNSGPSWKACNPRGGGGDRILTAQNEKEYFQGGTWHESYGDGASVSLIFTGTRVVLTGASALAYYNTRINGYIDGELKATYTNVVTNVETAVAPVEAGYTGSNYHYGITLLDIGELSPGQHTFRATSVGANCLFAVDTVQYEASDAASSTSTAQTSSSSDRTEPSSSNLISGTSAQSAQSTTTLHSTTAAPLSSSSSFSSSHSSASIPTSSESVVSMMDIKPSNSRIVYSPVDAWTISSDRKRAESCLTDTISSTIPGSSVSFNFTGSALRLYTISSEAGGRYSVTLDGQSMGTYDTHIENTALSQCSLSSRFAVEGLNSSEHSLVMTIKSPSDGSNHTAIQFAGFRLSSLTISPTVGNAQSATQSRPSVGAIIGGVVGGLILLMVIGSALYFLKKRRTRDHDDGHDRTVPDAQSVAHLRSRVSMSQYTDMLAPPEADTESNVDRLTYYTLPRYRERVLDGAGRRGRDLSEADVNAIARRLMEVMRQSGQMPLEPPGALVDQLVEQQLRPREDT